MSPFQVKGQNKDSSDKAWPSLEGAEKIIDRGRPFFVIDLRKLELAESVSSPVSATPCNPTSEGCADYIWERDFFFEDKSTLHPDVMMRHYPNALLGAPFDTPVSRSRYLRGGCMQVNRYRATGTYVYYLPKQNVFYLYGDCGMNHFDGVAGPFAGDPRLVLKKLAEESAAK